MIGHFLEDAARNAAYIGATHNWPLAAAGREKGFRRRPHSYLSRRRLSINF
jgi:hypothetical protein